MATELKLRRDVEGDIDAMTPAEAEPIYDITNKRLRVGDGSTAGGLHLAAAADLTKQTFVYAAASGTDTLTLTLDPAIASYTTGLKCAFSAANNNTGAVTIAINGLGAKTIKKNSGADDLEANDLISGGIYEIAYDGTNMQLLGRGGDFLATEQGTSSGSTKDFTGIPAGVKRITMLLDGVSINGSTNMIVQLGDTGGIETTGYLSAASLIQATVSTSSITTGFLFTETNALAAIHSGQMILTLEDAVNNTWMYSSIIARTDAAQLNLGAGRKSLSAVLTQVRLSVSPDAFDLGAINILFSVD